MRRVAEGGSALDPQVVAALLAPGSGGHAPLGALTEREQAVLSLVAQGHSNAAIATRLRMAERTVESHMRNIFHKLRIHDSGDTHRRVLAVLAYLSRA
ncbi:helix-turn-helix transcriptional regulator [Phytohabitans flavus]|uniref:helix-turn-helix domain-containing protein n=1 Tax=Phytohabitans flavus TaxID=1076124 RepID=UPI0018DA32A4|nr:LuxR C-terminal-related transcriptional regulator [Phytohabitans flavus]